MKKTTVLLFSLLILDASIAMGQTAPPKNDPATAPTLLRTDNPLRNANDSMIDRAARDYFSNPAMASLVIGVLDKNKRTYYGYARSAVPDQPLVDSNTLFEIGSITKTFTSWLLADAVTRKKAALDDPAKNYLPPGLQLKKDGKEITLVELSNHSSGLPRLMNNLLKPPGSDFRNPYKNYTKQYLLEYLAGTPPVTTPGSHYEYSNIAPAVLALALESIDHASYDRLLQEKILDPLHMRRTFLSVPPTDLPRLADGHSPAGTPVPHWDFSVMAPIGAIKSSAGDMLNWLQAQLGNPDKAFALSQQPTFKAAENLSVGLAWHISYLGVGAGSIVWHNGATGGFNSFAAFDRNRQCAVILLANNGIPNATDLTGVNILRQIQ